MKPNHSVTGVIVPGDGRGRILGFPTANLRLEPAEVPADGVYVALAHLHDTGETFEASASVGTNPTFSGDRDPRVEVYLHDVNINLYGRHVTVELIECLRETVAFAGVDELIAQTERDVARSREVHARLRTPAPEEKTP